MTNKLPKIFSGSKICIICEGDEEYEYLENADGNGNIPARYQDKYQNGSYDVVLVFCDTDKKPYEQYADIKRKINEFHGANNAADYVIIFGNPCTMQIIIEHWDEIVLDSNAKKRNAPIILKFTGIKNYKGRADQRQELFSKITKENYWDMLERIKKLPNDDTLIGSSNFGRYMQWFSSDNEEWIEEINEALD